MKPLYLRRFRRICRELAKEGIKTYPLEVAIRGCEIHTQTPASHFWNVGMDLWTSPTFQKTFESPKITAESIMAVFILRELKR